jgi:conjugative transfer region protein TrbK
MRGQSFDIGTVSRIAGFVAVVAAIVATSIHLRHDAISAGAPAGAAAPSIENDPLARELARCRAIGMAAKDDAACEAAWAENRRRFFSGRPPSDRAVAPAIDQPPAANSEDR